MRILLVEDEDPKRNHIEAYLKRAVPDLNLTCAKSVNTAIDALDSDLPDLLLLDMSLPTFDVGANEGGGRPQGFGGIEVIRYMVLAELKCFLIIVTGYEAFPKGSSQVNLTQLKDQLFEEFGDLVYAVLHFNSAYDDWKTKLSNVITELKGQGL